MESFPQQYELKITWKAVLFAWIIVCMIALAVVPWMVGAIKIVQWIF